MAAASPVQELRARSVEELLGCLGHVVVVTGVLGSVVSGIIFPNFYFLVKQWVKGLS